MAGGRTLQSGPRVLPPLPQDAADTDAAASDASDATTADSLAAASTSRHYENSSVGQGSGGHVVTSTRFDSVSRAALEDSGGSSVALEESGGSRAALEESGGSRTALEDSSGSRAALEQSGGSRAALEDSSGSRAALAESNPETSPTSPDQPTALLRHLASDTPQVPPVPGAGVSRAPIPPVYGHHARRSGVPAYPQYRSTASYRSLPYIRPVYRSPYDSYSNAPSREKAVKHAHSHAKMGGLPAPENDLSAVYDSFAYPDSRDLTMGEELPPVARPDMAAPSALVTSAVQNVTSAAPAAAQQHTALTHTVLTQGTGSSPQPKPITTKKISLVKKPTVQVASSSLAINALKGKIKVGEKYESGFSMAHEELCENNGRELKVLVLITTAPDHEKHRTAVRQTWGHFSVRKDVVMAFVVGRTTNANVQSNIDKENELYGDIIQANFIDHYSNLTLKTISMFEWVKTYCSESHFILKTDDDMFINMPLLLNFIDSKAKEDHVMYGRMAKGWKPVRNKKSKYFIDTKTYSKSKYPDFLTGPAYLFTSDIVDDIYQKALDTTFFVLEDVLLTGIVGESLRIRRVGDSRFRNEKIKLTDTCGLMKTISIHMVKFEEQFDIYKRTLDGKAKCKIG
ncbi:uncharacterized protein [Procambarus clarkii]